MEIALQVLILIVGFVILIKGADWLVSGASSAALNFKVSKMLIGLTIVAFGTGAPELAVSISSMLSGSSDMLLGNVIGSNILNILLLIGVGALIRPIAVRRASIKKELLLLILASVLLVVLFLDTVISGGDVNAITRADALVFVAIFAIFMFFIVMSTRKGKTDKKSKKAKAEKPQYTLGKSLLFVVLGLAGVVIGSKFVVDSASFIAHAVGINDRIIALTVVALGTSLPELVTTITAARRGEHELIIGNIIGSNLFNICIVLGVPVLIFGTITAAEFSYLDLASLVISVFLLYFMTLKDRKITRAEGLLMLATFSAYYGYIIIQAVQCIQGAAQC